MRSVIALAILCVALGFVVLGGGFYVVNEAQQVVLTQFGRPVGKPITKPGLYFKVPFAQQANYFDKRFLAWDGTPNQIPTKDKRFILVDTYARWRIADPLVFFKRLRDERRAQSRLDDILDGETRNTVAKHRLIELVRTTNPKAASSEEPGDIKKKEALDLVHYGRTKLAQEVLEAAAARTADLGIQILDFRFKRLNYVEAVRKDVYARMISERQRIAEQYRSEGAGEAARIEGERDKMLKTISSEAYQKARELRGVADQKAAEIYAAAYDKNPAFYQFLKTMEIYAQVLDGNTSLVLTTDGGPWTYLGSGSKMSK